MKTRDVALDANGAIRGQVVTPQGRPVAGQIVVVRQGQREMARTACGSDGRFAAGSLRGGVYQVQVGNSVQLCRCWAPGTAPPVANGELLLVAGENVMRGQQPIKKLADPLLIGLVIAGAVAIPIAIHSSNGDSPPGS